MKQQSTRHAQDTVAPSQNPETVNSMKQFFVLLWVFWANLLWIFGLPSIYFVRLGYWQAFVSVPLFLVTLFVGWLLFRRSRREWQRTGEASERT